MSSFTTKDLKDVIRDSLGIDEKSDSNINEAYVAQPKKYRLKTELLSDVTKAAHLELYDGYIKEYQQS